MGVCVGMCLCACVSLAINNMLLSSSSFVSSNFSKFLFLFLFVNFSSLPSFSSLKLLSRSQIASPPNPTTLNPEHLIGFFIGSSRKKVWSTWRKQRKVWPFGYLSHGNPRALLSCQTEDFRLFGSINTGSQSFTWRGGVTTSRTTLLSVFANVLS